MSFFFNPKVEPNEYGETTVTVSMYPSSAHEIANALIQGYENHKARILQSLAEGSKDLDPEVALRALTTAAFEAGRWDFLANQATQAAVESGEEPF